MANLKKKIGKHKHDSKTTFFLWSGGNDIFFDYYEYQNISGARVASDVLANAQVLVKKYSAERVVVMNLPPLETIPYFVQQADPAGAAFAGERVAAINAALREACSDNGVVRVFDVHSLVTDMRSHPQKYGLADVSTYCASASDPVATPCAKPDSHLYFDQFHFSSRVYHFIAEAVRDEFNHWLL
ncbi:hypothetical protein HDU82_007324 [Entophlyctis luteolus]|nr:hypothetical protein HDU82_007324 [Entophlyctis luteolus]